MNRPLTLIPATARRGCPLAFDTEYPQALQGMMDAKAFSKRVNRLNDALSAIQAQLPAFKLYDAGMILSCLIFWTIAAVLHFTPAFNTVPVIFVFLLAGPIAAAIICALLEKKRNNYKSTASVQLRTVISAYNNEDRAQRILWTLNAQEKVLQRKQASDQRPSNVKDLEWWITVELAPMGYGKPMSRMNRNPSYDPDSDIIAVQV